MTVELTVILGLIGLVAFQQWFFFKQIQKFTDKIMAGNYSNYSLSQANLNESLKAPTPPPGFHVQLPQEGEFDELSQLNALLQGPPI